MVEEKYLRLQEFKFKLNELSFNELYETFLKEVKNREQNELTEKRIIEEHKTEGLMKEYILKTEKPSEFFDKITEEQRDFKDHIDTPLRDCLLMEYKKRGLVFVLKEGFKYTIGNFGGLHIIKDKYKSGTRRRHLITVYWTIATAEKKKLHEPMEKYGKYFKIKTTTKTVKCKTPEPLKYNV